MTRIIICRSARCLVLMLGVWTMTAHAQLNQVISLSCQNPNQPASCPQGEEPVGMIQASDGNFYGIANGGGSQIQSLIFKLTPSGAYTVLFTFSIASNDVPDSGLVEAPDGTLWGTASGGDGNNNDLGFVYKINKDGTGFQNVHGFARTFNTAFRFRESLTVGKDGNIYGASVGDGFFSNTDCPYGCGTVYRIVPATGVYTLLQEPRTANGSAPSRVTQASDGNLYGLTSSTLYRVTPAGKFVNVATLPAQAYLNDATGPGGADGFVGVIQGSNGRLFGVLRNGSQEPALIEMSLNGKQMHVFPGISALQSPNAVSNLLQAADGSLWFTSSGDSSSLGSLVQISSTTGALLQNIAFAGTNGQNPDSGLLLGADGNLYGTTLFGGVVTSGTGSGLVYSLSPNQ